MATLLEQLRFYLSHSWNDLLVNRRLSTFALLSIGAGVAAIVSLQLLAGMIGDSLTGSLQERNRGDIVVVLDEFLGAGFGPSDRNRGDGASDEDALLTSAEAAGHIEEYELGIGGLAGIPVEYFISQGGLDALRYWTEENFPGEIDFSYGYELSGQVAILFGNGNGVAMNVVGRGAFTSNLVPILVDSASFPLYGSVRSLAGEEVRDLLQNPTDIVVDEQTARTLELQVGDAVRLSGSDADFVVRGVVATEAEVLDPLSDIFIAIFGFYYLDNSALTLFENTPPLLNTVQLRLADPAQLDAVNDALLAAFPYFDTMTTSDIAAQNEDIADTLNDLVTVMGMISLLIGSIGVINTMQVVVRRRMQEIAVLKTLGLQGRQVNLLLLTESFLMGIFGSAFGLLLGIAFTLVLQRAAEGIVAQDLAFRLRLAPLLNGFVVGTLVATVFGLLPTLTAALIRPAIILRPSELAMPRVGVLRMLLALLVVVVVLTVIVNSFIGDSLLALAVTCGAFVAAGLIYFLLNIFIWFFGRVFPSFGIVDLKISLRQILESRARAATTLLALVVGVFSLSVITLFAQAIQNIFDAALNEQAGNLSISLQEEAQLPQLQAILAEAEGVRGYQTTLRFDLELVSLTESDGTELDREALETRMLASYEDSQSSNVFGSGFDDESRVEFELGALNALSELADARLLELTISEGRALTDADRAAESPGMLLYDDEGVQSAGIGLGERLTYRFEDGEEITLTVIGLIETGAIDDRGLSETAGVLLLDTLPQDATLVVSEVDVEEEHVGALRAEVSAIPGAFALDSAIFGRLLDALLNTFVAFPQLVAVLGLVVGGVVIANSVALATMERRREIAVMKSVGLQRERVLFMLLLENGLLGLLGGLVGVGIGLVALIALVNLVGIPSSAVPYLTAFGLMALCVLVSLVAAFVTAWGASGERPLNVLRYE